MAKRDPVWVAPNQGFRAEVTRACVRAIRRNDGQCPSCGAEVEPGKESEHASDCLELRADEASKL